MSNEEERRMEKELHDLIRKCLNGYCQLHSKVVDHLQQQEEVDLDMLYAVGDGIRLMHHAAKILELMDKSEKQVSGPYV